MNDTYTASDNCDDGQPLVISYILSTSSQRLTSGLLSFHVASPGASRVWVVACGTLVGTFDSDQQDLDILRYLDRTPCVIHEVRLTPDDSSRIEAHLRLGGYVDIRPQEVARR